MAALASRQLTKRYRPLISPCASLDAAPRRAPAAGGPRTQGLGLLRSNLDAIVVEHEKADRGGKVVMLAIAIDR
jgi:hypothetical protein